MKGDNKSMLPFKFTRDLSYGFTLVEMIVVIGLISLVATIVLATINPVAQIQKSNDAHRKSDLEAVQHALELYYQDKGMYPPSSANYQIMSGVTTLVWGNSWQPYINMLPKDPTVNYSYVYYSPAGVNANQSFYLYAHLQRGGLDPQACNKQGTDCPNVPSANACGAACNYGITSTNVSP